MVKRDKPRKPVKVRPVKPELEGAPCLRIMHAESRRKRRLVFCGKPATEVVGASTLCAEHAAEAKRWEKKP